MLDRLPLPAHHREAAAQVLRFAVSGGAVTLLGSALYAGLVQTTRIDPQLAMFAAYVVCVLTGYGLHSRWSFRGHGSRDRPAARTARFVAVSLVSYGLNAFWVWALVTRAGWPRWTPVVPLVFLTPLATFTLNRRWVFA